MATLKERILDGGVQGTGFTDTMHITAGGRFGQEYVVQNIDADGRLVVLYSGDKKPTTIKIARHLNDFEWGI